MLYHCKCNSGQNSTIAILGTKLNMITILSISGEDFLETKFNMELP